MRSFIEAPTWPVLLWSNGLFRSGGYRYQRRISRALSLAC
jgi:hypothetical protein